MKKTTQKIWGGLLHFIYPRLCVSCRKALIVQEEILCLSCADALPLTNYHHLADNETAKRFAGRINFKHATSYAYFAEGGVSQSLMHDFKYKKNTAVGVYLARRFANALLKTTWIKDIDIIIPVPLHKNKFIKRGYNQSEIVGQAMAGFLNIITDNNSLIRIVDTESQTQKSRSERAENMKDVFALADSKSLKGKHILLLDDVLTTGATLESCVATLQEIEGITISIATIGIAMD